jgi:hypothetical protein
MIVAVEVEEQDNLLNPSCGDHQAAITIHVSLHDSHSALLIDFGDS